VHRLILRRTQGKLSIELTQHQRRATLPLKVQDPFILTSCLQKTLRHGDPDTAFAAAGSLLTLEASRLWRRLVICAFEDFGLSDLDLTASVVAAAADKRWRATVGGDDHVASYLIERMIGRPRDRRVDALYMLAVRHVRHPASRADFLAKQPSGTATNLVLRAEKVVSVCEQEVANRSFRAVIAAKCDQTLRRMAEAGLVDEDLRTICVQGRRTSMCLLPVLLPLIKRATEEVGEPSKVKSHDMAEVRLIGGVPGYAICGFTRLGKAALAQLAHSNRNLERLVCSLRGKARSDALTYLLFEAEGGVCTTELSDPLHDELKWLSWGCWTGLPREVLNEAIETMRTAVPQLNDIRQALWERSVGRYG